MPKSLLSEIHRKWKPRKKTSNKGDFGRVFVLAGSKGLSGAAHMAGMGALKAGAGLVTVGVPGLIYLIVARREDELMVKPLPATSEGTLAYKSLKEILAFLKNQNVLALGPGLSQNPETQKLIRKLIAATKLPLVIDADALNALKGQPSLLRRCRGRAILTPHPGEFRRVFGYRISKKDSVRKKQAQAAAKRFGVIIVLKGYHTVIADPNGQVAVNPTGNPGMATGGIGDVLTGVIAALIGQKFSLWDSARFGVFLHGLAGDLAAKKIGQVGLLATDLLNYLPQAIKKAR
jgi:NAD(P)H-hydrate epimerase